jgi:CBS-domain-containing membrane protein
MRVTELMSRDVLTIDDAATCLEAAERMCQRKVRHLPVLDSEGRLTGIVTDRDLRHYLFGSDVYRQIGQVPISTLLRNAPVRDVMSAPVRSVTASAEVADAAERMRREKVGCLPVIQGHRVVGMLTEIDVLRHIAGAEAPETPELDIVISYP